MSLQTWKDEFYSDPNVKMTKKQVIQHSLKKWTGLRKENLEKHDCRYNGSRGQIEDGYDEPLGIDTGSCALCVKYLNWDADINNVCRKCPLYESLGEQCDAYGNSPFQIWIGTHDPEPMIEALEKLLK
jgi:hypothetical protein